MTESKPQISVAPMMDWTDRHCRYFHRLISPNIRLYTEMVTTGALIFGDADRHLRFDPAEHPVAVQLGGSDPADLAKAARMSADYGYDEINLNCGCPSDRVQSGCFGAILMETPDKVADCYKAMQDAAPETPVTVKCRIAIDEHDEHPFLHKFIETVSNAGCKTFIVHARKAWLQGLSPKENRDIPPLRFDIVHQIKQDFPDLEIILNGGIGTTEDMQEHLPGLDGVMIGRRAYQDPWFMTDIERDIFGTADLKTKEDVVLAMIPYIDKQQKEHATPVKSITRHMLGLFQGERGAKNWRRILSTEVHEDGVTASILEKALNQVMLEKA